MNTRSYNLYVKTLHGKTITLRCDLSDTVELVKLQIEEQSGIDVENQRLIFAGKHLENNRTLNDYHLSNNCTVHLVERLR